MNTQNAPQNEEEKEIVLDDEINDDDLNKDFFQMEEREI